MKIKKQTLSILLLFIVITAGFGVAMYFATKAFQTSSTPPSPPTPTPTPTPSPPTPSPPSSFSVQIPALYGFFLEFYDTSTGNTVYGCYQIGKDPPVDIIDDKNYKITLTIQYYEALFQLPTSPDIDIPPPAQPPIGTVVPIAWPPVYTKLTAEIDVDPADSFPDNHLSITIQGLEIVLIRYSLKNGVLTINYNKDLSEKYAIGNENDFPTFDTSTMIQQSATDPDTDFTFDKNMCTCTVKAINNKVPGFVLMTLTVATTAQEINNPPEELVDDYQILLCSALIDSSVQEIIIYYYLSIYLTPVTRVEGTLFSITLSKKDDSDTITFGNSISSEMLTANSILDASPYSLKGCAEGTIRSKHTLQSSSPNLKSDNPACDLCSTNSGMK